MSFGNLFGGGGKPLYKKPLEDAQADSVIKKLGSVGSSALQTGLYALDTPGSLVRGGIGKLVGANASDHDRVSGRDLTDKLGFTKRGSRGWGAWGAGLAAEIATDPLTFLTGPAGALFGSGKAAAKVGATKGLTRLQMLRGFDATEDGLRALGHSDDIIAHARHSGQAIANPQAERAIMQADPSRYVSQLPVRDPAGAILRPAVPAPSVANQPLGGLIGVGLPFAPPSRIIGTGATAQRIARGLDRTLGGLKYGTTLGRWANGLFDNRTHESVGGQIQRAMVEAGHPAYEAAQREGRDYLSNVVRHLDPAIRGGIPEDALLAHTRDAIEGIRQTGTAGTLRPSAAQEAGDLIRNTEAGQLARERSNGFPLAGLDDRFVHYGPRQGLDIQAARDIANGQVPTTRSLTNPQMSTYNNLPVASGENFHRDEIYRNVPGGTNQLSDFARQYAGSTAPTRQIERDLQRQMIATAQLNGHAIDRDMIRALRTKSEELAGRVPNLPIEHNTHGIGMFSNNEAANAARSAESFAQKQRTAATVYRVIGNESRNRGALGTDAVPISRVLRELGFTHNTPGDLAAGIRAEGSHVQAYNALARQGLGPLTGPLAHADRGQIRNAIDNYALPRSIYNDLIASHGRWTTPETLSGPLGAAKNLTTTFKNLVYPLFPASNFRNATTGIFNNVATGANLADHTLSGRILRDTATADDIRKYLPELPLGATDDQARDFARQVGYTDAKVYNGHAGANDLENHIATRLTGTAPGRVTPEVFGSGRAGGGNFVQDTAGLLGGAARDQGRSMLRMFQNPFGPSGLRSPVHNPFRGEGPLAMEGVWGHGNHDFPALQAGRQVGTNIEDFLRMAKYLGERRKGFSGEVAGDATRNLHFDYDQLTKFEKNAMRQAFPFYTFMRKNLPLQAHYLAHYPSYPLTQMRAMDGLRDQSGGYTPGYLASGAAVPIAGATGLSQRYISGFGTPLEEAMERIRFSNGMPDLVGTAQQYMASGNPFIKAPLEQVFDKQLSTGRSLSSLRAQGVAKGIGSLWGDDNPQLLAQMLANSPAARFASSFDKLADDRKPLWARALNLGTGVKITDVDLERQKAIEATSARDALLRSMPHITSYTHFAPRRGEERNLTPQEVELLQLIPTMRERAIEAARQRGQQIQVQH
jgi:hypothetical protein